MKSRRLFKRVLVLAMVLFIAVTAFAVYKLNSINAFIWLGDYLFNSPGFAEQDQTVDIIFFVPDHWEPGGDPDILNAWMQDYRKLADKHVDADGRKLQHSWYYPIDQFRGYEVDSLCQLCIEGYGDVDVHLHHRDDNSETLRKKLVDGLDSLQAHGVLNSADGVDRFSFVHGNWALDNSRLENDRNFCGVNDEISILLDLGCYADATFPSLNQLAQPKWVNKFGYAVDDPEQPKSYDDVTYSKVGLVTRPEQLLLMQGPMVIDWSDWRFKTHPTIEDGNLYWEIPTSVHRFENWLKADIHVDGRPNWVFVRPFMHGAGLRRGGHENMLGRNIDEMLTEVEAKYNDGKKYRLHYMTAREAYNVVKAAEAGMDGNPNDYRDYVIKPMVYSHPDSLKEGL